ncbi:hypothetical protein K3495_g7381 [Podosphaera aphanis]|nr:hypothetical protein K3495_g7381 [Podosphaera aphanis]
MFPKKRYFYNYPSTEETIAKELANISDFNSINTLEPLAINVIGEENSHPPYPLTSGEENSHPPYPLTSGEENSHPPYPLTSGEENNQVKYPLKLYIDASSVIQAAQTGRTDNFEIFQMVNLMKNLARTNHSTTLQVFDIEIDMSKTSDPTTSPPQNRNLTETFPKNQRPKRRPLSTAAEEEIDEWFKSSQLTIGPACPNQLLPKVKKLMYTYRDLHANSQLDIEPTDLYIHRVRLAPETKPHNDKRKIRLSDRQRYWLARVVDEGLRCGMYERTTARGNGLSSWNARPVVVMKESVPNSEMRVTFNYSRVTETMPGCHMVLLREVRDYLSDPRHSLYCQFDFKNAYWAISVHPDDRHIFAFFVDGIGQLQPTVLPQGCQSATFTLTELMYIMFGEIPPLPVELQTDECDGSEPSLLQAQNPEAPEPMKFYMDDLFIGHRNPVEVYNFLEHHFLPRIAWGMLKLSFKKVKLFMEEIEACGTLHKAGGVILIKHKRAEKISNFPEPVNQHDVMSFLATIGVTRNWVKNFGEIARPFQRLTGNVLFQWGLTEQISFQTLRKLCSEATEMHGIDPILPVQVYTDASKLAVGCRISQRQYKNDDQTGRMFPVPILFDSMALNFSQQNYGTYKRELFAIVEFTRKYNYMLHTKDPSTIYTDHRPLTYFLDTTHMEGIYARWASELRMLNIKIEYIQGPRNKVADALSRTIFPDPDCRDDEHLKKLG